MFDGAEYGDDVLMKTVILRVFGSLVRNDPGPGLLQRSGGRLFQSLAVLGKNEYLCTLILHRGNAYLNLSDG